ncbi:MAG: M20/M25/M40 family metallo-hydrolase [Parvularculaceae bacterium]|nr:M20/M25/M40 family metallo-hydrolase [Parvularculaceae bacterium]
MKMLFGALSALLTVSSALAATEDEQAAARALYEKVVSFKSTAQHVRTPALAGFLKSELVGAGFAAGDVEVVEIAGTAALVARYRGAPDGRKQGKAKKPVLFLAHMDVVEADPADWDHDPFTLREEDGWFIARGVADNKYGVVNLTQAFMRLKREGFTPDRDLILVFTGDEETEMASTRFLAFERPDLAEAEFALNSDAGGGALTPEGAVLPYFMQAAEKTYASFRVTARNPGGHSSAPRPDNAIYDLASALLKISAYKFPVMSNEVTRESMRAEGALTGGEIGAALIAFADDPKNKKAIKTLRASYDYGHMLSTTCVATQLKGGHAENALPQSAEAIVNCRIFPGVSVDDVRLTLGEVMKNPELEIVPVEENYTASPVSEPRADVNAALQAALDARHPGIKIVPAMSSGGTDGMHFRIAGVPTYGVSAGFSTIGESENAHGLNERVRVKTFYDGLDHWVLLIKALAGGPGAN